MLAAKDSAFEFYVATPAEVSFRPATVYGWMTRQRTIIPLVSAAYLFVLAVGQRLMASRPAFRLPRCRLAWNAFLSVASLLALSRVLPAAAAVYARHDSLGEAACASSASDVGDGASGLWLWLFAVSKLAELGDTAFLVLGKKPLSLLHTWHHSSILVLCWESYLEQAAAAGPGVAMNLLVHGVMYAYFAANDLERPPLAATAMRKVAMCITTMQLTQFAIIIRIMWAGFARNASGAPCALTRTNAVVTLIVFCSYFILFLRFADRAYGLRVRVRLLAARLFAYFSHSKTAVVANGAGKAAANCGDEGSQTPQQRFEWACAQAPLCVGFLTPEQGMRLYGLFKLATCGEPTADETALAAEAAAVLKGGSDGSGSLSKAQRKASAWVAQAGRSTDECRLEYADLVEAVCRTQERHRDAVTTAAAAPATAAAAKLLWPVRISGTGSYLPERVVTNREVETAGGFDEGSVAASRIGVVERRRAAAHETSSMMAARASRQAIAAAGLSPRDLDCIINASGCPQQIIPDGGPLLQRELGLGESGIPAFSVHGTCLSFVTALETACSMLARPDGKYTHILISSSEITSAGVDPYESHTAPLFGDAAAACVVSRAEASDSCGVHAIHTETFGSGAELCTVRGGGSDGARKDYPHESIKERTSPIGGGGGEAAAERYRDHHFAMDGPSTLRFIVPKMAAALERLSPGLSRGLGDIRHVVPHQASGIALDSLSAFGWGAESVRRTLETRGNCVAASIPLTLHEGIASGDIRSGDKVLLVGTSAGCSVGGVVLTI